MKRVFIIHGWDGKPGECWFPWLKQQLEQKGINVVVPQMPEAETPKIETWVPFLAQLVGTPDAETFLVGHSIGVQTILRYLASIDQPIGGVVAVSGFYTLAPTTFKTEEEKSLSAPWLETPIDNEQVKKNALKITAIFSDNDPYVGLENEKFFADRLGAKTIIINNKKHIGGSDNVFELPEALAALEEMIQ